MPCRRLLVTLAVASLFVAAVRTGAGPGSIAMLVPPGSIDAAGRARLDSGAAWVDALPARGHDLVVYGAVRTTAGADGLVHWARQSDPVRSTSYVQEVGRFSDPPQPGDVSALVLDAKDLDDLRGCRPGDCGLKLSAAEIAQVRASIAASGRHWKPAAEDAFRRVLLARARSYQAGGDVEAPPYDDHRKPVLPAEEFESVVRHLALELVYGAGLEDYLRLYPHVPAADVESFLSWSKEMLGGGRPIVSITHVNIVRSTEPGRPEALVVAKQVYASHYLTASMSVTALTEAIDGAPRYLLYARRSRVDVLTGPFGGLVRRTVHGRIRSEGPRFLEGLRTRLEIFPHPAN